MTNGGALGSGDFRDHSDNVVLSVPPRPDSRAFAEIFNRLKLEMSIRSIDRVTIEMTGLFFVHPLELSLLRLLTTQAARLAASVSLNWPSNPDTAAYLKRMDTFADLPENVKVSMPRGRSRRHDLRERLVEAFPVSSQTDVKRLEAAIDKVVRTRAAIPESLRSAFVSSIIEAASNVVDHADSPIGGIAAAQFYRSNSLEVAVVDAGVGIPATLRPGPTLGHLSDAGLIQAAFDFGTSRFATTRGVGLSGVIETARRVPLFKLAVRSGSGNATIHVVEGETRFELGNEQPPISGTWFHMVLFG